MSRAQQWRRAGLIVLIFAFCACGALAAPQSYSSSGGSSSSRNQMMMDVGVQYVRDTKPDGSSDTAGRFSLGGMANDWVGVDGQGMFEGRSKNYLVGGDVRLVPMDWFFIKLGGGAYADKETNSLIPPPIMGAGILAHVTRDIYFVTEGSYFSVNTHDNITFGVGLGTNF